MDFCSEWTRALLNRVEKCGADCAVSLLEDCAQLHYQVNDMDTCLEQYIGDLDGFIGYLTHSYQWIVNYSDDKKKLLVDENKDYCVCPVAKEMDFDVSPVLCHCSENYARRMFSKVLGKEVTVRVLRSILRDGKSCIYEITL